MRLLGCCLSAGHETAQSKQPAETGIGLGALIGAPASSIASPLYAHGGKDVVSLAYAMCLRGDTHLQLPIRPIRVLLQSVTDTTPVTPASSADPAWSEKLAEVEAGAASMDEEAEALAADAASKGLPFQVRQHAVQFHDCMVAPVA